MVKKQLTIFEKVENYKEFLNIKLSHLQKTVSNLETHKRDLISLTGVENIKYNLAVNDLTYQLKLIQNTIKLFENSDFVRELNHLEFTEFSNSVKSIIKKSIFFNYDFSKVFLNNKY